MNLDDILPALVVILSIALVYTFMKQQAPPQVIVVDQPQERAPEPTATLPYWTLYGLPNYWPSYLSPYWLYEVPYGGPIVNGRGYYAPHGSRFGYSGVASGGGGGHGGGHGGH